MKLLLALAGGSIIAYIVMVGMTVLTGSQGIGFLVGGLAAMTMGAAAARDGLL